MRLIIAAIVVALSIAVVDRAPRADPGTTHARPSTTELSFDGAGMAADRLWQIVPIAVDDGWRLLQVQAPWDVSRNGRRDVADGTIRVEKAAGAAPAMKVSLDPAKVRSGTYRAALKLIVQQVATAGGANSSAGTTGPGKAGRGAAPTGGGAAPAGRGAAPAGGPAASGGGAAPAGGAAASDSGTAPAGGPAASGSGTAGKPDVETVDVVLMVTVAAPAIDAAKALRIEIVDAALFESSQPSAPLAIDEKSGRAGTGPLSIRQRGLAIQDGKTEDGVLRASPASLTIAPGSGARPAIAASEFPIGASDATLQITGDELAAPIDVAVHVVHRRGSWLIVLLFLIGVGLGFGVRTWAQAVLDREHAAGSANAMLDQLRDLARRSRPKEAQQAAEAAKQIRAAARTAITSKVTEAVTKAQAEVGAITTALTAQLGDVRTALVTRAKALGLTALPPAAREALAATAPLVDRVEAALIHGDVAQADAALAAIDAQLHAARLAAAPRHAEAQRDLLAVRSKAPATVRTRLDAVVAEDGKLTAALDGDGADDAALIAADQALRAMLAALRDAVRAMQQLAADVRAALPPAVAGRITAATACALGDGSLAAMMSGLQRAIAATHAAVRAEVGSDPPLAAGDFVQALLTAPQPKEVHLGGTPRPQPRPEDVIALPDEPEPPPPRSIADVIPPDRLTLAGTSRWRVQSARAVQIVATVVILPTVAWYVYEDSFIGTCKELLAIGATGFLTDASLGSATTWLGKLKK